MGWKFLITGEGNKKPELKDIIGEEEYNKLLGEIQESLEEPAPSYSIEFKNKTMDPIKECLFPRQNGKSTLLKKQIMEKYGYGDANDNSCNLNYEMIGYTNLEWLSLMTEKCNIHGIVEKARYVIYFFTETDLISRMEDKNLLKEVELELNKLNGQEFIDKVTDIERTVRIHLMFEGDSDEEVKNED